MSDPSGTSPTPQPPPGHGQSKPSDVEVVIVPPDLRLHAAARLIVDAGANGGSATGLSKVQQLQAAQRFIESAAHLGIDLSLMWCTLEVSSRSVRQAVLCVPGSGRTVLFFVSGPETKAGWKLSNLKNLRSLPAPQTEHIERVALIRHACQIISRDGFGGDSSRPRARLAQALLDVRETEAAIALQNAGFTKLGDLAYLRKDLPRSATNVLVRAPDWPADIRIATLEELAAAGHSPEQAQSWLLKALEGSYIDTLDCPELCGKRDARDVLESHQAVGVFDPGLWWIVFEGDAPMGCLLLSAIPEQDSAELVYLGLAPGVRGKGLGKLLMDFGTRTLISRCMPGGTGLGPRITGSAGFSCAVDTRNTPALKLYKQQGFVRTGVRIPLILGLAENSQSSAI